MSAFLRTASRAVARPATAARSFSTTSPRPVARITIIGNLADVPETRASSTGREYIRYAVASNSGPRDNRKTSWFQVSSFVEGVQKDFIASLPKGTLVLVEGDVSISTYTDAENKPRQGLNVVQRNLEVLRRPPGSYVEAGEHEGEGAPQ
ncbi:ssDNA binding protein [Chaetomium strumarium]|uniref:SsDNA binding protein n=1 Tax=Chaetomium strumarium TaxID=1170767 RepID=A0AAJ0LY86_9PEZI|nr:ssDNA binding protein [Chaetomium strumarium]